MHSAIMNILGNNFKETALIPKQVPEEGESINEVKISGKKELDIV